MSKVVFKSPYSKSGGHIGNNVKYIATRDGVNKSINTRIIINNLDYIAHRPRVVKLGEHGLFGQEDYVDLEKVSKDLKNHKGVVWQPIISLRREDAERLGYNNPETWRTLLRAKQIELAATYRIPIEDLKWYAAYHDEGHHPHVHMIIYNNNPGPEYLTGNDCDHIRESFIKTIFRDELKQLYDERQSLRDRIIDEVNERLSVDVSDIDNPTYAFEKKWQTLKFSLEGYSGKQMYKYVSPKQKKCVNEVLEEVCKDENIQNLYQQWCRLQLVLMRYYSENPKEHFEKLENNKDFYRLKNAVLKAAFRDKRNDYKKHNQTLAVSVYADLVFNICKMIDESTDQTMEVHNHSKSIVDSKERMKIKKHKEALGQHMGM